MKIKFYRDYFRPEYQEKRLIENIYSEMIENQELDSNIPNDVKSHNIASRVYKAIQGRYLKNEEVRQNIKDHFNSG